MDNVQSQLLKKYLDLFWRRKTFIAVLFLLSLPAGLVVYLSVPKVYQATSLLSYQQEQLSPNKMSPDMKGSISDTVSTLTQIVTSRNSLEELIKTLGLYQKAREKMPIEDVIELMRKDINIKPSRQGDTFLITYDGGEPDKVVKVVNALAAKFIEENLQYRQERATETSSYTSDELNMSKVVMDKQEIAMRDYKLKNYNEMPDRHESNVARLISLQEQYQRKQDSIQDLERTLVLIQDQINAHKKISAGSIAALASTESTKTDAVESPAEKLNRLRLLLGSLQGRYTQNHPKVKSVQKQIEKLEADFGQDGGPPKVTRNRALSTSFDQGLLQLESQKKNIQISIENIELEKQQLKVTIAEHEKWVSSAPVREAEWAVLTREYGQLKKHYEYLVTRNLEAKSMLNLERSQRGSQFKIEDPARYPSKPMKPNFVKILALAAFCGLGAGVGLSLVHDFADSTFRNTGQIESFLGVPVVGVITYVETDEEKRQVRIWSIVTLLVLVLLAIGILGVFYLAWSKGMIVI